MIQVNIKKTSALVMFWFISLLSNQLLGLPSDNEKPITLQSDRAEFDRINGRTTYSGSVVMEQGSMKIKADKVVIYGDMKKVTRIVAEGAPAEFQQTPDIEAKPVTASGNKLEYQISDKVLYLVENAKLQQEGSILTGPKIIYDVEKSIVQAGDSQQDNSSDRVRMVIPSLPR